MAQEATDSAIPHAEAGEHVKHGETLQTYLVIYAALMVLLVLTVVASFIDLGHGANLAVAMTIAIIKGTLVVLFFMHVRLSSKLTWVFASAAFLWLAILFVITFADYFTRSWTPQVLKPEPAPVEHRYPTANQVETNRALPHADRSDR
jgi:cytochrome c oxidase subunit 4